MPSMTPRQRVLAALSCQPPDVIPFDLGGVKTTSLNVRAAQRLQAYLGDSTPLEWGNFRVQRVRSPETLARFLDVDVRAVGEPVPCPLQPELSWPVQVDPWGIEWTQAATGIYFPSSAPLADAQTADDLRRYPWPDPLAWQPAQAMADRARQLRRETDYAICIDLPDAVVQIAQYLRGLEQWLLDLALDRKFAALLMGYVAELYVVMVIHVMKAVGENADLVLIPDDLGGQQGLLFSPEIYREIIKPLHARVFEAVKANSTARVVLHSCGSVSAVLGDLIDVGVDGLNPVQVSAAHMDTAYLKREFGGRICFWGAIDTQCVLPFGTPDEVRREVRRRIADLAEGGGYVVAPIHIIQGDVPPENILAMAEAAHVYGGRSDGSRFRIHSREGLS